jgi:hypothetical protein
MVTCHVTFQCQLLPHVLLVLELYHKKLSISLGKFGTMMGAFVMSILTYTTIVGPLNCTFNFYCYVMLCDGASFELCNYK